MKIKVKVTSDDIKRLLANKHAGDVLITECKNGQSWGRDLRKLDAWVLHRSWSPLTTIGYEIKVSRQDFEQDQKWIEYVDYCHVFYFVCPAGLIRAVDLPKGIGLIWTTMSGTGLQTKIKADRHNPDLEKLNHLMTYIIMARSVIVSDMYKANEGIKEQKDRIQEKADMVREQEARKELSYLVKGNIRKRFEELTKRCEKAELLDTRVDKFAKRLALLGIKWDSQEEYWQHINQIENEIDLLGKRIDYHTLSEMKSISQRLGDLVSEIEKQRELNRAEVEKCATNQNRT